MKASFLLAASGLLLTTPSTITPAQGLACDSKNAIRDNVCAYDENTHNAARTRQAKTGTGCCCPVTVNDVTHNFGPTLSKQFCYWAESRDTAKDHMEVSYGARCTRPQAEALYDLMCPQGWEKTIRDVGVGLESVGNAIASIFGAAPPAGSFLDHNPSPDCALRAAELTEKWQKTKQGLGMWLGSQCPCDLLEREKLGDGLKHCKDEGFCMHMRHMMDPKARHCDSGQGIYGTVKKDGERSAKRAAEDAEYAGREKERQNMLRANQQAHEDVRQHARIREAVARPSATAQRVWDEGREMLANNELCCGKGEDRRWTHCSKQFRRADRSSQLRATFPEGPDWNFCFFYKEQYGDGGNGGRPAKKTYSAEEIADVKDRRHERRAGQKERLSNSDAELHSADMGVLWRNAMPSSKELQVLIDNGIVRKRTMGKYMPNGFFGTAKNPAFDSSGWEKYVKQKEIFRAKGLSDPLGIVRGI
jgi:hypothetical protein